MLTVREFGYRVNTIVLLQFSFLILLCKFKVVSKLKDLKEKVS